ncbi:MAG: hypothetical protein GZ091_17035 [Paludibacter sp.]|nr:hypothetical protein [Paludibacter sp.]
MKVKLLSALILFISQVGFSQTIKGKVVCNNYAIPKVEVINATTKNITVTDANGEFSIIAKTNDALVFVSKEHQVKKLIINPKLFTNDELDVELILKAEELNEVLITNMPSIKISKDLNYENAKISQYTVEKAANRPIVKGVNMGTIENGITKTIRLYGRAKEKPQIEFIAIVKASCNQNYFVENLQLKPDEIELFLQYCEIDPRSKIIPKKNNALSTMDFLLEKSINFKKL